MEAARTRGRQSSRPRKLSKDKIQLVVDLYNSKKHSLKQICEMTGISKPTLYKYVDEYRSAMPNHKLPGILMLVRDLSHRQAQKARFWGFRHTTPRKQEISVMSRIYLDIRKLS